MGYEYDYAIKTLIVGDSGVGKSSIMNQFVDEKYNESYKSTIGVDYKTIYADISDKSVKFLIWDTAGQERFNAITKIYYRGAHVILYVFDITDRESYENIPRWIKQTNETAPEACIKILVGNKCDFDCEFGSNLKKNPYQTQKREVSYEEAIQFSKLNGFLSYYETSAKTNKGIVECFLNTAEYYVKNNYSDKFTSSNYSNNNSKNKSIEIDNHSDIKKDSENSKKSYFQFKYFC